MRLGSTARPARPSLRCPGWLSDSNRSVVGVPGSEWLSGSVEADEVYVGGKDKGVCGRSLRKKALVAVAAREDGAETGQIRLKHIPDASSSELGRLHSGVRRTRQRDPNGWPAELFPAACAGLPARDVCHRWGSEPSGTAGGFIEWLRCSSADCWEPTKALRGSSTWTTTLTNSPAVLTAAHRVPAACCSISCWCTSGRHRPGPAQDDDGRLLSPSSCEWRPCEIKCICPTATYSGV